MVLVISLWDDYTANLFWLDSDYPTTTDSSTSGISYGTCFTSSGIPATVEAGSPNTYIVYSNIKVGPINSTFSAGNISSSSPPLLPTTLLNCIGLRNSTILRAITSIQLLNIITTLSKTLYRPNSITLSTLWQPNSSQARSETLKVQTTS
jgi:hypothetical protein